jgi:hypothetical protein
VPIFRQLTAAPRAARLLANADEMNRSDNIDDQAQKMHSSGGPGNVR